MTEVPLERRRGGIRFDGLSAVSSGTLTNRDRRLFTTSDGLWFQPTGYARGPWDANSCHAGPPTALLVRALERLVPNERLARITVELMRPIPMDGFRVQAEIRRPGRSVTFSEAEILDCDRVYARAFAMHLRRLDHLERSTAPVAALDFAAAVPGRFPISSWPHDLEAFPMSVEVRYDPAESLGEGGPITMWMRTKVPILVDEEPSPFQRVSPLADCGNGVSYNDYLDRILFLNPDLEVSLHREPAGEWFCSKVRSHWQPDGTGLSDAELFDATGPAGRAVQNLLLMPA